MCLHARVRACAFGMWKTVYNNNNYYNTKKEDF